MALPRATLRPLAISLPLVFALHVLEESPGFVIWFNQRVDPNITDGLFLSVNAAAFAITVIIAAIAAGTRDRVAALVATAWVGFLLLANAIFHLVAALAYGSYVPGIVTGTLLYLPVSIAFIAVVARKYRLAPAVVTGVALLGGLPMYIHGWLIVFRGTRLF